MTVATRLALALLAAATALASWRWWLGPRSAAEPTALSDSRAAVSLRWRAPGACIEVYRLRVDESYRHEGVAMFLGREEEHQSWLLALQGQQKERARDGDITLVRALIVSEADGEARFRSAWWGPLEVGPAAPDFACRRRSWDPFEDALALGWPRLPPAPVRPGARWQGAAIEGRCHETTCLDADGKFTHDPAVPCRARPWDETLLGTDATAAALRSRWDDGQDPAVAEIGILTSREALLVDGRPERVEVWVEHRWAGVTRTLILEALDDCRDRSAAPPDNPQVSRQIDAIRARLRAGPLAGDLAPDPLSRARPAGPDGPDSPEDPGDPAGIKP